MTSDYFIDRLKEQLGDKFKVIRRKNFVKTYETMFGKLNEGDFIFMIEYRYKGVKYHLRFIRNENKINNREISKIVKQVNKAAKELAE